MFSFANQKLLSGAVNMDKFGWLINQTKPSKQGEFCNYLLYKSVVSRGCQSGSIGQSGPGAYVVQVIQVAQVIQVVQVVHMVQVDQVVQVFQLILVVHVVQVVLVTQLVWGKPQKFF